jgi:Zn-dependent alcohol dehydrogenase
MKEWEIKKSLSNSFMATIHPMDLFDGCRIEGSVFGGFKDKSQLPNIATQ